MVEGAEQVLGAGEQDASAKVAGQEEKRLQVCRLPQTPVPPPAHTLRAREAGIHESQHGTVPPLKERVFHLILVVKPTR